jgi:lipoate-protein ligase A
VWLPVIKASDVNLAPFVALDVYHDGGARCAAMNMAIDEALLEHATVPSIRFYRWQSPALSFGYFGKFADVAEFSARRDLVRRWTGGGIVFHGEDLTYSIVIPAGDPVLGESSMTIYEKIHRALADALNEIGAFAGLAEPARPANSRAAGQRDAEANNCFMNPVRADVIIDGRKVAGAAQRRTRRGLLHQGSVQGIHPGNGLVERFAQALSANRCGKKIEERILNRAREIARQKYGCAWWLAMR